MTPLLKLGSTGRAVQFLQARLSLGPSGTFDTELDGAVRAAQAAHALTVDGVYGPVTNAALTQRTQAVALSPEMRAVVQVETKDAGFYDDGRPVILLERHYVWARASSAQRLTLGPALCSPTTGGYVGGIGEWDRFERVAAVCGDEIAAQSTSWGLGQVMGANHTLAGYPTGNALMMACARNEDTQLAAMAAFINAQWGMKNALVRRDWTTFARLYNGPNYAANQYDTKLAAAFAAIT